jgi:short-subunit dehydrogenase
MEHNGKQIALITGATSGIGAAFARRFAADGYDLIITGRREEKINALANELGAACGARVEVVIAELSDPDQVAALADKVAHTDDLEILVNNAGFANLGGFVGADIECHAAMLRVHVLAPMALAHAALPHMISRGSGTIINVSSLGAFAPTPGEAVYSGTKAFLRTFSEALHLELAGTGVQVQVLCPGFTRTDFHAKLGMDRSRLRNRGPVRWMSPEEVVETSLRCLKKQRVISIPGFWNKVLVWLCRVLPRPLYYRVVADARL